MKEGANHKNAKLTSLHTRSSDILSPYFTCSHQAPSDSKGLSASSKCSSAVCAREGRHDDHTPAIGSHLADLIQCRDWKCLDDHQYAVVLEMDLIYEESEHPK